VNIILSTTACGLNWNQLNEKMDVNEVLYDKHSADIDVVD